MVRRTPSKSSWNSYSKGYNMRQSNKGFLDKLQAVSRKVTYLAGMVNSEKMYFDTTASANYDFSGAVVPITNIAAGDDEGNRTGNSILGKSIYFQLTASKLTANTNPTNNVRIIIVQDKLNTGTAPTWGDLIATGNLGTGYAVLSPLNIDHTVRYKILMDKRMTLSTNGTQGTISRKYIKMHTHINYTGTAATDYYKNNIYVFIISDQSTSAPLVNFIARFAYHDN